MITDRSPRERGWSRRRTVVTVLLVVASLAAFTVAFLGNDDTASPSPSTGVLGDIDGDLEVSGEEQVALDTTRGTAEDLTTEVFASRGVDSRLVTPAGDDWWSLVTSVAAPLEMWNTPAPSGADWYAVSEGKAYGSAVRAYRTYQAVHVKMPDQAAAEDLVVAMFAEATGKPRVAYRGDGLITLVPAWVDPETEPFPDVPDPSAFGDREVPVALWSIDLRDWVDHRAAETPVPSAYRSFWSRLGFGDTSVWTATSATPEGPWIGEVTDFDAEAVDASEAAAAITGLDTRCEGSTTDLDLCPAREAMTEAIYEMWVADDKGGAAGIEDWQLDPMPADFSMFLGFSPSFRGTITGTRGSIYDTPVTKTAWWVTAGTGDFEGRDLMYVQPVFDD